VPEQDRSRLFLFVLGVAAVHALCLAAVLPALFILSGQDAGIVQGAVKQDAIVRDTIVDVELMPSSQPTGVSEASDANTPPAQAQIETVTPAPEPSPAASLSSTPDPSELTSALPGIPQPADAPSDSVSSEPAASVAATSSAPDLVGNASPAPASSPPAAEDAGTVSAADPAPTNAIPQDEAKPATTVSLPAEKPTPVLKPRPTAAKTAKPRVRRQASVTTRTQSRGMFGGFFQSKPRPKTQRATTTR
jgi:hypothetical protein